MDSTSLCYSVPSFFFTGSSDDDSWIHAEQPVLSVTFGSK